MTRLFSVVGLLAVVFLVAGLVTGDDKDLQKDTKAVKLGALPPNWAKLGLSDEQKKKARDIRTEYQTKIHELEEQIRELRKKERVAMEGVLTDSQRARLKELILEKAPGEREKKP
jgi:hypothetical protein